MVDYDHRREQNMWIMMNDGFVSIVEDKDDSEYVLVRGRVASHVKNFLDDPSVEVHHTPDHDYHWRARIKKTIAAVNLLDKAMSIDYTNFKASTIDNDLHVAYNDVWTTMYKYQREQENLHKYGYGRENKRTKGR